MRSLFQFQSRLLSFLLSPNVSPNLLPTQGNSDSRSSSNFPISWGENKNGTQTPLRLDALRKRMRILSPEPGFNPNKYFYIQQIRCQAGLAAGPFYEKPKEGE